MADQSPKPRNVYIDDESWGYAKALAKQRGVTISRIIREGIGCLLGTYGSISKPEEKK